MKVWIWIDREEAVAPMWVKDDKVCPRDVVMGKGAGDRGER